MTIKNTALLSLAIGIITILGAIFLPYYIRPVANGQTGLDDPITKYQVSTSVWVGKDIATTVAAASPGRSYLEISNISGATSTPTSIYCAVGVEPVLYKGIVITASSTRMWGRQDSVPTGPVKCLSANASSTVTVVSK